MRLPAKLAVMSMVAWAAIGVSAGDPVVGRERALGDGFGNNGVGTSATLADLVGWTQSGWTPGASIQPKAKAFGERPLAPTDAALTTPVATTMLRRV